ncbi:MAG: type VI secretion system tip protein VgrG [Tannerellaceae bacterium]|nr:type VI secretion system tip protein VgrG [Tannerellaceae bacterium]
MADQPEKNSAGLVTCTIYSEGKKVKSTFELVSVWIRKEVNRIGKATLVWNAGNITGVSMKESEDETFAPGKKIRIEGGYSSVENVLFEGMVTTHRVEVTGGITGKLVIECRDYAFPSTLSRRNRLFEKMKDSEAITQILKDYPALSATVEKTTVKHTELVQYYCSDWDFILSRADGNGLIVLTEGKKITIHKPVVNSSPVLEVTYGKDLIDFEGSLETMGQTGKLEAWSWDCAKQELIKVTGVVPSLNKQGDAQSADLAKAIGVTGSVLQTESCADRASLQSWADGCLLKTGLSRIRGALRFQGNAKVVPGSLISLKGLGSRFDGDVYVGWVEHELREGDWVTQAGMGIPCTTRSGHPDVMAPVAAGLLPGIQGLHIGKVIKLNEDPACEYKVQVEFPLLNGEKNSLWARMNTFWASKGSGSFFLPDVGDEVVIGFLNNDPCHAVLLGSLYSSKRKPAYEFTAKNNIRGIVSRSKMKLEFEEEKKIITISTPGKNQIEISDDGKWIRLTDQHNNKIEMLEKGIHMESAQEITLKAKTNITLDAGMSIEVKAKKDLSMQGLNIEAKTNATLTAKGAAKAELSATGQTVVSGALVKIN